MLTPPTPAPIAAPPKPAAHRVTPLDDVVYQVVTVGAILLVLGTVWVF